jgi:hypothetical protein
MPDVMLRGAVLAQARSAYAQDGPESLEQAVPIVGGALAPTLFILFQINSVGAKAPPTKSVE